MDVIAISDTHRRHDELHIPSCDLLIHAGDFTKRGKIEECLAFLDWYKIQPAKYKVLVAGNHDEYCESHEQAFRELCTMRGVFYLQNEGLELENIVIWGSPITPDYHSMAFNRARGEEINAYWKMIPTYVDVLITHGPPLGVLDETVSGARVGCEDLLKRVFEVQPQFHLFGHIHEAGGQERRDALPTCFANLSSRTWLPGPLREVFRFQILARKIG